MKFLKALSLILACLYLLPAQVKAQEFDVSLKARVTGFTGKFGETYTAIGYEPALTIKPTAGPLAFGLSYSRHLLNYDANSDLKVNMSLLTLHAGAKGTVAKYFHPFAYVLTGARFMTYENEDLPSESSPIFTSVSLSYGARTGMQVGGKAWRFEASAEYLTGTNTRYLTPDSFRKATNEGKNYRDFTERSPISGLTVSAGVAYRFL